MERRRAGIAVLAGLLLAACARSAPLPDSGVEGRAWVGPMCPVVQEGVACPDRALEADLAVVDSKGHVTARARSDEDGTFRIALAPGAYLLTVAAPEEAGLPFASPIPFEVSEGAWASLDAHFDSGIR